MFKVQEGDNTEIAKPWVFKVIESQAYIGGKESVEIMSETIEESSLSKHEGKSYIQNRQVVNQIHCMFSYS